MKKFLVPLVVFLMLAIILSGCSQAASPAASPAGSSAPASSSAPKTTAPASTAAALTPKSGGTFKFIDPYPPTNTLGYFADPAASATGLYMSPIFEFLLTADTNGNFKPQLAESWEIGSDMKSITLKIRKGVKFHDGSDLTGGVVKWNLDSLIAAKVVAVRQMTTVDLIDDYTIKVNLSSYTNTLLSDLTTTFITSQASFEKNGAEYMRWNPIGTGPFKFVSYQRGASIKYAKFNDYWQKGKPYLDAIEMSFVTDSVTRSTALLSGQVDAEGGPLGQPETDMKSKGYQVFTTYDAAMTLVTDSKNADSPFSKLAVRQALDYAIDRDAIAKARGFGFWVPTYQLAPPGSNVYINDLSARAYNPAKAKQLLSEAGFANGFDTIIYSGTDLETRTAIQGYLKAVGINVKLTETDISSQTNLSLKGWNNSMLFTPSAFSGNPNKTFSYNLLTTAAPWSSLQKTNDFDQLYKDGCNTKNIDPAVTQKAVRYIFDNAMVTPLYCTTRGDIVAPYVHDTGFYTLGSFILWTPADTWLSK